MCKTLEGLQLLPTSVSWIHTHTHTHTIIYVYIHAHIYIDGCSAYQRHLGTLPHKITKPVLVRRYFPPRRRPPSIREDAEEHHFGIYVFLMCS